MAKRAENFLAPSVREELEKVIANAVEAADEGYEIVEIAYTREYGRFNVTVFIWHENEVTLDDCERVHGIVSDALDAIEDLLPDEYVLNVSSQGLDRPVVSDDDFRRAMGTELEVLDDNGTSHGVLTDYTEADFTLVTDERKQKTQTFKRNNKTRVQPYIRF